MIRTGLNKKERDLVNGIFSANGRIKKVVIFGSRASGKFKRGSNIDFAICGVADDSQTAKTASVFDELPLPCKFDVLAHGAVSRKPLRRHIEKFGKVFYNNAANSQPGKDGRN